MGDDVLGCDVAVNGSGSSAAGTAAETAPEVAPAVDMETAAIAREAVERGVPFIAVGAVSDGKSDPLMLPGSPTQFFSVEGNRERWARMEAGKRRLVYAMLRLGLPLQDGPADRLAFAFLADRAGKFEESGEVMTGHADGLITINIAEADDAVREQMRLDMHELYRTVLGHFRHEVGHYYWERLIRPTPRLEPFRQLFGDERADYDDALQRHYNQGPAPNWQEHYVSAYATAHPWEDWAETWAHYLHIIDTLDTAAAFELRVPAPDDQRATVAPPPNALYRPQLFAAMIESWLPLTYALNCVNRSMGQTDLYPFVLSQPALDKLRFVHDVIGDAAKSAPARGPVPP